MAASTFPLMKKKATSALYEQCIKLITFLHGGEAATGDWLWILFKHIIYYLKTDKNGNNSYLWFLLNYNLFKYKNISQIYWL